MKSLFNLIWCFLCLSFITVLYLLLSDSPCGYPSPEIVSYKEEHPVGSIVKGTGIVLFRIGVNFMLAPLVITVDFKHLRQDIEKINRAGSGLDISFWGGMYLICGRCAVSNACAESAVRLH